MLLSYSTIIFFVALCKNIFQTVKRIQTFGDFMETTTLPNIFCLHLLTLHQPIEQVFALGLLMLWKSVRSAETPAR